MTTSHSLRTRATCCIAIPCQLLSRFGAQVVIQTGESDHEVKRHFPALKFFAAEQDAVEYAKKWGEAWVDKHG